MAGQVGKLTLEAVIKGFEDVQGLGKALQQVNVAAGKTDNSFNAAASITFRSSSIATRLLTLYRSNKPPAHNKTSYFKPTKPLMETAH